MDIHRAFAEVVVLEAGKLIRLGCVDMRRALLQAFAAQLRKDDEVVIEATSNAAAVAEVIGPQCEAGGDRQPQASTDHRARQDQDGQDRRGGARPAPRQRLSAGSQRVAWRSGRQEGSLLG
jgi:hypothetical protein